ncbi:hypothetical protein C8R46DRAFT_1124576 [Mycena filopes]|nr:hypothetical protein C8R46DRAFT_1124576 [Mycena filopes]
MSNRELPWTGPHLYVFDSAPLLRDVTLNVQGTTVGMDAEHAVRFYLLEMPWSHLTRLSLAYDNPRLCLDSVLCCPNLISATITTEQWTQFHSWGLGFQPAVLMPRLEVLDILINIRASPPGENFEPFLQRIDAPALKTLELLFDFVTDELISVSYFTTALTRFLTQASRVERLRASNCLFSEELQIVLPLTPALTELVLEDLPADDALFTALQHIEAGTTPPLVPKLEILELLNVGDSYHETTLAEMIKSRWWADAIPAPPPNVARLKRVKLWNEFIAPKTFTPEFEQTMKSYRAEGLQMKGLYFSFS